MANYNTLKTSIEAVIKQNGNKEITGPILQQTLLAMVNSLGSNYQYAGIATPSTNPGTPDQNVFYIASTAGTYANFGGLVLADGEIAILKYNGAWSKDSTGAATAAQLNQLGQEIYSGTIDTGILKKYNFVIGDGQIIRSAGAYSKIVAVASSLVKKVTIIPINGTAIVSFLRDIDFVDDETIQTPNFSLSIPQRLVLTATADVLMPEDCKYIVFTDEYNNTNFLPTIIINDGVDTLIQRLNGLEYVVDSKKDYPLLKSLNRGVFSAPLPISIKSGHLYSIENNCGVNVSFVLFDESGERVGVLAGDVPNGKIFCRAEYTAQYLKIISNTATNNVDFVIADYDSTLSNISTELKKQGESRIDNGVYNLVDGVIGTTDVWLNVGQGLFSTKIFPIMPGARYKLLTSTGNEPLKRVAFLTDIDNISSGQLPHYAGDVTHVISRTQNEVIITAPNNAFWLAVLWSSSTANFAPMVYELNGGEIVRKKDIQNEKDITEVEFLNAGLNGEEIEFVIRGESTINKAVNVSKDLLSCPYSGITYDVSEGYQIAFLAYDSDYHAPTSILNNSWYSGQGSLSIPTPYFRVYIKSSTPGTIITPESGYVVRIGHAVVEYGQNKDYYLIAAQDSEEQYKKIADFVAGEDARPALQIAADEAYVHGTILKLAPGTYTINSTLNNAGEEALAFSQFLSPHQYDNPYQGVTIEGLRKPNGYVGDAAIIKVSDSLYESINRPFSVIRTDPGVGQDWQTYFITTALNIKNLIIQIPNNQKPIHAIDLSTAEGGSRLEGLRIVGIPIIDGNYFPAHAHERSIGVVSNPGSTWNTNSYWNDIEIHGFYYGVHIVGMEHAFVHNLTVQWCEYGLKFNGGGQHPIQLIAVQDEHNVNLPDFGEAGRAIEISGYNASWPETAPGFPNAETEGWYQRKRATGNPIGSIEYTNNITPTGGISTPVDYPTYFEYGQGLNMKVRNMKHSLSGTSNYRRSIAPNYLQRYYDMDVNKELICVDTQNKTWVDTQGNIVP